MRVLVIERDQPTTIMLVRQLRHAGMHVDAAVDGTDGLEKALLGHYDVVVLERDLDGLSGDEVCWRLHSTRQPARLLMLSTRAEVEERVSGLDLGADDYLTKPFAQTEFVARVRALGRRQTTAAAVMLRCGDLELDPHNRSVHRGGARIHLANKEFRVLEMLLRADGALVSSRQLIQEVWARGTTKEVSTSVLRVTMRTLRVKLGEPPIIQTVVRVGYQVRPPAPAEAEPLAEPDAARDSA
ncbi:response regulator transcription factor [Jatrophihabitans sp.]|uniref:response regulator transcription factor n=1 Tax=Jatrophihabitans sp. TaxID=1932789 RepID=UPI0030C6F861|nr:DNA-binding response regulator [Jatrophihabitans sp.]